MKLGARVLEITGLTRHRVGTAPGTPEAASRDLPPAVRVELIQEGDHVFLYRYTATGESAGDTWHETLKEGKAQALREYRIRDSDWKILTDIWDHETIAKGPNPNGIVQGVPDSGARPGESAPEWAFRMFLKCLQTLAAEPDVLVRAYDPRVDALDEVVSDLRRFLSLSQALVETGVVPSITFDKAFRVDRKLSDMSGPKNAELWSPEALSSRKEWPEVRQMAKEALADLGYDPEPPPPLSM